MWPNKNDLSTIVQIVSTDFNDVRKIEESNETVFNSVQNPTGTQRTQE